MNDYSFGNFVCFLRERQGLTQAELAKRLGVTAAAVSKWENGSAKPRVEVLFQLAEILSVRPEELMAGHFIPHEALNPDAVRAINERYEYLRKVESYQTMSVKWRRVAAAVIDWNLSGLTALLFMSVIMAFAVMAKEKAIAASAILLGLFAYFVLYTMRDFLFKGRSLGKRLMGLVVVDRMNGLPARGGKLIARGIFFFLIQIDFVMILASGLSIGDRVAQTVVLVKADYEAPVFQTGPSGEILRINSYQPPAPMTAKRWVILFASLALALFLFGSFTLLLIDRMLEVQKNKEEYQLAYDYLVESDYYASLGISQADISLVGYSRNTERYENQSVSTVVYTFDVEKGRDLKVVCHEKDGTWSVCEECTNFD